MRKSTSDAAAFPWARWHVTFDEDGDPVCLSLVNTRNWRNGSAPVEHLHGYPDVLAWAQARRLIATEAATRIAAGAARQGAQARAEFAAVVAFREAVYRVFSARAHGRAPAAEDMDLIVAGFNAAVSRLALVLVDGALTPMPRSAASTLEVPRLHVALSAIALLTSERGRRVKECADDRGCGWLFIDRTRNGSRRYCFSNECGNRARQAAFRDRHRSRNAVRAAG